LGLRVKIAKRLQNLKCVESVDNYTEIAKSGKFFEKVVDKAKKLWYNESKKCCFSFCNVPPKERGKALGDACAFFFFVG
jgi:hypothetical protein